MADADQGAGRLSYYDQTFARLVEGGASVAVAVKQVAEAYLDGKPPSRGK